MLEGVGGFAIPVESSPVGGYPQIAPGILVQIEDEGGRDAPRISRPGAVGHDLAAVVPVESGEGTEPDESAAILEHAEYGIARKTTVGADRPESRSETRGSQTPQRSVRVGSERGQGDECGEEQEGKENAAGDSPTHTCTVGMAGAGVNLTRQPDAST